MKMLGNMPWYLLNEKHYYIIVLKVFHRFFITVNLDLGRTWTPFSCPLFSYGLCLLTAFKLSIAIKSAFAEMILFNNCVFFEASKK
jgi:hypothetical protein